MGEKWGVAWLREEKVVVQNLEDTHAQKSEEVSGGLEAEVWERREYLMECTKS